jgi:hypothetical protein
MARNDKGSNGMSDFLEDKLEREERRLLSVRIGELSQHMEKFNLAEYMNLLNNPRRYLVVNFLGGLSRGFGIAVGITLLGALLLWFLQRLVTLNLPLIGNFIAELVRIVLTYL